MHTHICMQYYLLKRVYLHLKAFEGLSYYLDQLFLVISQTPVDKKSLSHVQPFAEAKPNSAAELLATAARLFSGALTLEKEFLN